MFGKAVLKIPALFNSSVYSGVKCIWTQLIVVMEEHEKNHITMSPFVKKLKTFWTRLNRGSVLGRKNKKRVQLKKTVKEQEHKRRDFVHILAFKMSGLGLKERQAIGRLLGPIGELEGKFLSSPQHVGQLQTQNLRDVTEGHKHTCQTGSSEVWWVSLLTQTGQVIHHC